MFAMLLISGALASRANAESSNRAPVTQAPAPLRMQPWERNLNQFKLRPLWVNQNGEVFPPIFSIKTKSVEWPENRNYTPMITISITQPRGYALSVKELGGSEFVAATSDSITVKYSVESKGILFHAKNLQTNQTTALSLVLLLGSENSRNFIHPSCTSLFMDMFQEQGGQELGFLSAYCIRQPEKTIIFISHPADTRVSQLRGQIRVVSPFSTLVELDSTVMEGVDGSLLAEFMTVQSDVQIRNRIYLRTPKKVKRFYISPNLGLSYISYQEPAKKLQLTELGLTAKVSASYALIPGRLTVDGYSFFTVLPVYMANSYNQSQIRFWGSGIRGNYRFTENFLGLSWYIAPGGYFWSSIITDNSYGISFLGGPQLVLSVRPSMNLAHPFYMYLKLAMLLDQNNSFNFSNQEVAAGAGYTVGRIADHPASITLDVANLFFLSPDQVNQINLLSVSLGFQVSF